MTETTDANLTEAEAAVYDRQLRVWGVEVQKRLNNSKVLIAGLGGLAAEVAKNIILAGVGTLTLMDSTPCKDRKAGNFLVPADCDAEASVAKVSAVTLQDMNPLVELKVADGAAADVESSIDLEQYHVVVLLDASLDLQERWDKWTTEKGVAFYTGAVRGPFGSLFANLHSHTFAPSAKADGGPVETKTMQFCSLEEALRSPWAQTRKRCHRMFYQLAVATAFEREKGRLPTVEDEEELRALAATAAEKSSRGADAVAPWEEVRDFVLSAAFAPMPAVSAALGGVLAQEVLKAVSLKGEPVCNFFFFSMADCAGTIEKIGC